MLGDRGTSFPVAGVAVVALFLSTTLLQQNAFDFLRQPETAANQLQLTRPAVEARLWEDPFEAQRRHLEKLKTICSEAARSGDNAAKPTGTAAGSSASDVIRCLDGQARTHEEFRDDFNEGRVTLIVGMLPGGAYVGREEARRRSRYALLAGLNAAGYVPEESDRMNLLNVRRCLSIDDGCPTEEKAEKPGELKKDKGQDKTASAMMAAVASASQNPAIGDATATPSSSRPRMDITYETFIVHPRIGEAQRNKKGEQKKDRIVVLWVDDSLLGDHWLSALTVLLSDLTPPRKLEPEGARDLHLRIVGPNDSDAVVNALVDMEGLSNKAKKDDGFGKYWDTLSKLRLISPISTASDAQLLTKAKLPFDEKPMLDSKDDPVPCTVKVQPVEEAFRAHLEKILTATNRAGLLRQGPFFIRTIGTDDKLIDRLVDELFARGLDAHAAGASRRVALIGEWDTIYARAFADALRDKLTCRGNRQGVRVELRSYQYLRGLDGVTIDGAPFQSRLVDNTSRAGDSVKLGDGARTANRSAPPIEWPEGRDQRDYLRRLVDLRLGQNYWREPETEVQAIGIIGSDVNDKLMITQALRNVFEDRMVFTTDLDARLLHPTVNRYTRNLIVASSLPLALVDKLQCGVPPFRDVYQTATFLAARYAAVNIGNLAQSDHTGHDCGQISAMDLKKKIDESVANPLLVEIGRTDVVELTSATGAPRTTAGKHQTEVRHTYAALAAAVFLMVGLAMALGVPGPAMQAARRWLSPAPVAGSGSATALEDNLSRSGRRPWSTFVPMAAFSYRSTVIVAGLQAAALGFAGGVVVELWQPGSVGPVGTVLLALLAAVFFWTFLYPGSRWIQEFRAGGIVSPSVGPNRRWELFAAQIGLFAVAAVVLWMVCVMPTNRAEDVRESFGALNGASAWPSQLLRTLSILLFAWFLDYAWCKSASQADAIEQKYFLETNAKAGKSQSVWWRRAFAEVRDATIWLWQPKIAIPEDDGAVNGAALWREYRDRLLGWPRLARIALWLVLVIGTILLVTSLVGGSRPEIPARGIGDRTLFLITLILSGMLVLTLLVLVADTTVLTWRFVTLLKRGRTLYPEETVKRFAIELGAKELQELAVTPIAASSRDRDKPGRNTLLDDWIDARLLAEHTAAIGPLIIFPFILVALMIVARSQLFDNWQMGSSVLIMFASFVAWSLAMAALLNYGAEGARRMVVARMEADLLWLKGAGDHYAELAKQFPSLIEQVRSLRDGAFAPFFEQPLVRALLVPLGGAGGIQLLDLVLFAR